MPSGILNIKKPRGMTSFAVVSRVKRLTGERRVGHAGTLDPIADGVLPVCLGRATRIVEYLVDQPKAYRGAVRLGVTTDSYDSEGSVVATGDSSGVSRDAVEAALARFVGEIDQLPPLYSALKHEGKPLYRYARAGKDVPRRPRKVTVHRLALLSFELPVIEIEVVCGRGAYVRSLAHDLGEALGCGGHLEHLTRLRSGPFTLEEAIDLDQLRASVEGGAWEELLNPVDRVLESWPAALLGPEHTVEACQGRPLALAVAQPKLAELRPDAPCRAYSVEGEFLAVLRFRGGVRWQPEKVFVPQ
jgi:tRNA pseudouridine55 synthase